MSVAAQMPAAPANAIRYVVRFPAPQTHYASIEATFPTAGQNTIDVFLPVWTPGSYLIREYARHVEALVAADPAGKPLRVIKSSKNRWRIETGAALTVRLAYRVYCHEMSVRTNWVEGGNPADPGFALLNGAATFITLTGNMKRPHEVRLELPSAWKTSISALPNLQGVFLASDYDRLVDSPILAGNPAVYEFEVDGIPHYLVNQGEDGVWDAGRSAADVETIVRHYRAMWGALPYRKYVFFNMITELRGGLEHADSLCMMTSRWATKARAGYIDWLALVSHEFFHAWNIKRLRPVELGPFNYEIENPTKSLWIAEGITDYYAPLALHRAGLTALHEYLGDAGAEPARNSLSAVINTLQTTPGRLLQSAEQASLDAWIKFYRPDENTSNTAISYYTKGAVVGWLLDARIRHTTDGAKSLDDLMRLAYARYSGEHGFTPEQFKATAEEVAGAPLADFFALAVESTGELDYTEALDWFGLRFKASPGAAAKAWLGAETKIDNGRLLVSRIPTGTPAAQSALSVDDEIIAIGDFRVRPDQLAPRLALYEPGDRITVLAARRDKLVQIDLTLGDQPPSHWQLEVRPDATAAQKRHLEAWLAK